MVPGLPLAGWVTAVALESEVGAPESTATSEVPSACSLKAPEARRPAESGGEPDNSAGKLRDVGCFGDDTTAAYFGRAFAPSVFTRDASDTSPGPVLPRTGLLVFRPSVLKEKA